MRAVVVGAGPGLGRSLARNFAGHGLDVVLVARDARRLRAMAAEIGPRTTVLAADAADAGGLARALADLGDVHILAYNAHRSAGRLSTASLEDLRAASEVNLHSALAAVAATLPGLRATSGTVLFTGGGLALAPVPELGVLSAGKAALRAAALALAGDLAPEVSVRTITIAGAIRPGTDLDPDRVAGAFWDAHLDRAGPVERVLGVA